jgi:hypothetical protein
MTLFGTEEAIDVRELLGGAITGAAAVLCCSGVGFIVLLLCLWILRRNRDAAAQNDSTPAP